MARRTHLTVSILILAALLIAPAIETITTRFATPAAAQGTNPPSILVIQTDDMRADDLKAMPKTKNLLQSDGMTFTNYMAGGTPLCCPNRSTALTGQYPHNHGVLRNGGGENGGHRAFAGGAEQNTIATALTGDYETALLGKYMNGYPSGSLAVPPGWDHWHALIQDQKAPDEGYYYNYKLNNNGKKKKYGSKNKDYTVNVTQKQAMNIIVANRDNSLPLFLYVNARAPHGTPVPAEQDSGKNVPGNFKTPAFNAKGVGKLQAIANLPKMDSTLKKSLQQKTDQRRRTLRSVDRMVAMLYAAMPDNSYIFFFSDNGYLLGEFRIAAGKSLPYKASAEVPLLVAHKPVEGQTPAIAPGSSFDFVTSSIDLAPTWADIAGTNMPGADGLSLLGVLQGSPNPPGGRESILLEFVGSTAASLEADLEGDPLQRSLIDDELLPDKQDEDPSEQPQQQQKKADKQKKDEKKGKNKDKNGEKAAKGKNDKKSNKKSKGNRKRAAGKQSRNTGVLQPYDALRGDDWLYIEWSNGHQEYYDHTNDQYELTNIYNQLDPGRQDLLTNRLNAMTGCDGSNACTQDDTDP